MDRGLPNSGQFNLPPVSSIESSNMLLIVAVDVCVIVSCKLHVPNSKQRLEFDILHIAHLRVCGCLHYS